MTTASIIKPVAPNHEALKVVVKSSSRITIFSPFYTASGLFSLESAIKKNTSIIEINFNCRLTKHDWIQGGIDPVALLQICKALSGRLEFNIAHNDALHAKAYYSDKIGLVGSANLTSHGFGNGLEFLLIISGEVLDNVRLWFEEKVCPALNRITLAELEQFIGQNIVEVNRSKKTIEKTLKRRLPLFYAPVDRFIDYCIKLHDPAAEEIIRRVKGKHQLSGHVKNLYYVSHQFFDKNRDLIEPIAGIPASDFHLKDTAYLDTWIKFIKSLELIDMPEIGYYTHSTQTYLPKEFGGRTTGGGGGRGSLDRLLPLVARFIIENQSR